MVHKYCPQCKDCIPVACKSCPCGHRFAKTVAECAKKEPASADTDAPPTNRDNGRPKRRSAMNSLYFHNSLQLTSYKLAKQSHQAARKTLTRKSQRQSTDSAAGASTSTLTSKATDTPPTNGQGPRTRRKKKKRGRPRIRPRPEEQETEEEEEEAKEDSEPKTEDQEEEILPQKRNRPVLMSSALMRNGRSEPETKTARTGRVISESESYGKLYQSLSDARKKHFSIILAEINSKFSRNANFPL